MTIFGIGLNNDIPIPSTIEQIKAAEAAGFTLAVIADAIPAKNSRDIIVTLTSTTSNTKTIKLASGISNPYMRHPAMLASTWHSLSQIAPKRLILGLGVGGFVALNTLKIPMWNKPLRTMRESFHIIRSLMEGGNLNFQGQLFQANNISLKPPPNHPIPLWLAARGPKMTQLIGEVADGGFCNVPLKYIHHMRGLIDIGAKKGNRNLAKITVANWLPTAIDEDMEKATSLVIRDLTYLVPGTPEYVHRIIGTNLNEVKALEQSAYQSLEKAIPLVTPFMLDNWTIRGDVEAINRTVDRQIKAGIDCIIFGGPFGANPIEGINTLGKYIVKNRC